MRPLEAVSEQSEAINVDKAGDTNSVISEEKERKKSTAILQNVDPLPTIGENEVFDEAEEDDFDEELSSNNNSPIKSSHQIHRNMSLNIAATQACNEV